MRFTLTTYDYAAADKFLQEKMQGGTRDVVMILAEAIAAEREKTKEACADFVKHWLIESDNEYAVEVAVECSFALIEWDGKS